MRRVGFSPSRFILIFYAGTDFGGSLELSTPRCGRDIEVIEPDRFVPGASPGTGGLWLPESSEQGVEGIFRVAEVPAPSVFSVVFALQFWEAVHADGEVCIETSQ